LAFTTLGQTADAGQPTGSITVELEDLDGNPAPAGSVGYSGNGTTADTTGGANLTLVGGAGFAAGQTGQALSLNGANQYAITPNLASLFANSNASVTVSLWFNAAGPGVIMDELGQTALNTGWHDSQIEILANGTVEVRVWGLSAVTLGTASFNAWHNVVLRYSAGTQTLDGFLDGVQSTSSTSGGRSTPYGFGYGLYYAFGATDTANLGSGAYFNGLIQNISIFNHPLSNTEVQTLYGGGSGVAVTPTSVTLSSSSTGGSFSYPNGLPISGGQIIIPQGASSFTFDYTDTQPGTPMLTASAAGFASATQQETILPAPISDTPSTDIVVGRTLSAYFTGNVQNNQETITFTVYNQQADTLTGVLLTDTLAPGVTLVSASQQPDQSGQNLAWSLGTIEGDYWTSVSITVSLANSSILQLDTGARAFATLNAGPISNSTPAAMLTQGSVDPNLLASTPDANTTDPYIQQEAAVLDYNAQNIFNFLHNDVGYNSYTGSLRGARGTLWSDAGNALDVASLGVALMRASGIPAQYVQGTLSYAQAQTLILSMFPASYQTVGYIPAGTQVSDPANDQTVQADGETLQEETESHYWFEFNTGNGWENADPLMAGAQIGQTFTAATGSFTEVAQSLRQTTEVSLTAEIYSQAAAAFGLNPLQPTVVLDQTFNDVDLVGRPLTIGNLVSTSSFGALILTTTTNTYTPYIVVGDDALPDSQLPDAIIGQQYQEFLTNFPLASQILTGLFLNITLSGGGTTSPPFSQTLVDRIGYAARQGLAAPENLSVNPSGPPIITPFDLTTLNILPGLQSPGAAQLVQERATQELASVSSETNPTQVVQAEALTAAARANLANFAAASDQETANLARGYFLAAYFNVPRITVFSSKLLTANSQSNLSFSFDLVHDSIRAVASLGQNVQAPLSFAAARGIFDSFLEAQSVPVLPGGVNLSSASIIQQSMQQGIPMVGIGKSNLSLLQTLNLPADAIARITTDIQSGLLVIVPTQALTINATPITAWWIVNPTTGEILSEGQDGGHQGLDEVAIAAGITGGFLNVVFSPYIEGKDFTKLPPLVNVKNFVIGFLSGALLTFDFLGILGGFALSYDFSPFGPLSFLDPPVATLLVDLNLPHPTTPRATSSTETGELSNQTPGQVSGTLRASSAVATGNLTALWQSTTVGSFLASSFGATVATVVDSEGTTVGSGTVALLTQAPTAVSISGNAQYNINGQGSLSFYGPANLSTGVAGNWNNYSAMVAGNISITLTTDGLTLNGETLPAGTYSITTNSATLSGSGQTTSPNFAGSASITATNGTVNLGPGSGNLTVGGISLDVTNGATLDGYTGSITVAGGGNNTDAVTLSGNAANVLSVSPTPTTLSADQNTPVTFQANVNTSLADTYTITAQAPAGWTVTIDSSGSVTATPAPGLQGGTYPIQVVVQSSTDLNLVAQTTVDVTVKPTQPGMTFAVNPDPVFTVPYDGAQVPTAFRAVIHNTGPAADTYNLSFANVPSGFTLVSSATSDTVPAGQTGIVGIYLIPIAGSVLPAPGTPLSFQVTATSTSNPAITQTVTESFTMPAIDAVTIASNPVHVSTVPGLPATATVTLENVGNVAASAALTFSTDSGLTLTGLSATPITLAIGQTATETVDLTPAAAVPLNTTLQATVNVGPASLQNVVSVVNVTPSSSFAEAGQTVTVSADVLNAVTATEQAEASFKVLNGSGNVVLTSTAVPLTLSVLTNVATVNLGSLGTSALAPGQYTIQVSIADSGGNPIPGATGTASLVIDAPVTASLAVSSNALSPGTNTVFNTLTVGSQTLLGSVQTDGEATSVALNGNLAYVANTKDIAVVNVSDPTNPQIVTTFGSTDLNQGGLNLVQLDGSNLVVTSENLSNSTSFNLLVFSLANPSSPQLLSNTTIPYAFTSDLVVQGNTAFIPIEGISYNGNGNITDQFGDFLAVDLSNPAAPQLAGVLFNDRGAPRGSDSNQFDAVPISSQVTYVAGSTSTGANTQIGNGSVLVVNTANPASMSVADKLDIPGTVQAVAIAVDGNEALVVGSTGGWQSPFSDPSQIGLTGNVTLTMLNISNPLDPTIIGSTVVTQDTFPNAGDNPAAKLQAIYLGNGQFAVSDTLAGGGPALLVVNASNPANLVTNTVPAPADINGMAVSGDCLLATSGAGLDIYQTGALTTQSVTAKVTVPTTGAAAVVSNSFSVQPIQIIPGSGTETLVWDLTLAPGAGSQQITWETTVNGLAAGQVVAVATGASIQLGNEQFTLPASNVAGVPETQTIEIPVEVVAPGVPAIASAAVAAGQIGNTNLANQLNDLSTALTSLVETPTSAVYQGQAVAALTSIISQVTNDPFLAPFASGLTAGSTAIASATTAAEVDTAVINLGAVLDSLAQVISDEAASGFTLSLSPDREVVLPSAPEVFTLVMKNNGSAATTYNLAVSGLPSGVTAVFSQTSATLQPGQSIGPGNSGVTLTLTESGTTLVPANFTITATAQGAPEITLSTPGLLTLRPESIVLAGVTATPPFTSAGGQVSVSAQVQAVVNEPTQVTASFTVTDPNGKVLFTSTPTPESLSVANTLTTAALGMLDTTGYADGTDTITVTLADATGTPIPGASAVGTLVIGAPVTGTLTTTPAIVPTGNDTVTTTVQVNTGTTYTAPLTLQGAVSTPAPGTSVALYVSGGKTYAYESGTGGINDIDVTHPTNPQLLETFGQNDITNGQFGFNVAKVVNGELLVGTSNGNNGSVFNLLVYSLANPAAPTLVSNTTISYRFLADMLVNSTGTAVYVPTGGLSRYGSYIFQLFGDLVAIDLSNPAQPTLASALFTNEGQPDGGDMDEFGGTLVNDGLAYITGLTPGGGNVTGNTGNLLVVNVADPTNMTVVDSLNIPGTFELLNVAVYGDRALVAGVAGTESNVYDANATGVYDNLTLTVLDISNPDNPTILGSTLVTNEQFPLNEAGAKTDVVSLGNGDFAVSDTDANGMPSLLVVDPNDPNNIVVSSAQVPSGVHGITVSGSEVYATTSSGLSVYQIGSLVSDPVTITVNLPAGTAANIVPGSFNIAPTQINTSANGDSLVWDRSFASGNTTYTFSWRTTLTNVQAGQTIPVTTGASIAFTTQETPGTVTLPATSVTGVAIISVSPASQTAQPGATATYDVRLINPASSQDTYYLDVSGLPYDWTDNLPYPYSVTIPADGAVDVPLTITSGVSDALGTTSFTVTAEDGNGATGSAPGSLTLAGQPVIVPDDDSHGIVATLTPSQATAGQGTSAQYVIQLTNTGSTDDTFTLTATGLPLGVAARFGQTTIDVPPGASNFRDVTLTLTPPKGTTPGNIPFTVTATSTTKSTVSNTASGTLTVVANGVNVYLSPSSGNPGSTFVMTVYNTGTVQDTFDLSLGGPAALVSSLATDKVTLSPGISKSVHPERAYFFQVTPQQSATSRIF
jgi:uncharacterized membrane protein